jgi:hypothetical protein
MPTKVATPKSAAAKPKKSRAVPASKHPLSEKLAARNQGPKDSSQAGIRLVAHKKETYRSQTIHVAGNAYLNCNFESCTLVVTNAPFQMIESNIKRDCNWRIELDVLAGDPRATQNLRLLLQIIEGPDQGKRPATAPKTAKPGKKPETVEEN